MERRVQKHKKCKMVELKIIVQWEVIYFNQYLQAERKGIF